jgi:hypothetical protein
MSPTRRTLIVIRELVIASIAAACLILCLAVLIIWPRSHWSADSYWWNDPGRVRALVTSAGSFELYLREVPSTAGFRILGSRGHRGGQPVSDPLDGIRKSDMPSRWTFLGFGHATDRASLRVIVIPAWSVALVTALVPPLWLLRHRKRRADDRRRRNLCVRCGYDLRASPERCPECGTPIKPTRARLRRQNLIPIQPQLSDGRTDGAELQVPASPIGNDGRSVQRRIVPLPM